MLDINYKPCDDEEYMCSTHLEYFKQRLLNWRDEIVRDVEATFNEMKEDHSQEADITDRASNETDLTFELRTRDRGRKLISKIDAALERIASNTYGFCEETGEPIGLKRLEARPIATLSIDAQERHEKAEKTQRDEW